MPPRPQVSWLPLTFIASGVLGFLGAVAWLAANPALVLLPFLHPQLLALVHLTLPGGLLPICLGALYQLAPVVLGAPLKQGTAVDLLHLLLHGLGVVGLLTGFLQGSYDHVALGGAFVAVGVALQACRLFSLFWHSARRDAIAWSLPAAALWLVLTTSAGVVLALNHRHGFLPLSSLSLLRAHAHAGLVGFFATLLQGVAFQLLPMFTLADVRGQRFLFPAFLGTQAGLFLLVAGLACDQTVVRNTGASVLLLGLGLSTAALFKTYLGRRRKRNEPALKAFGVGTVLLAAAALWGALSPSLPLAPETRLHAVNTYGLVLIGAGLPLLILGVLFKIVPFLVWMIAYGPLVGKRPVPVATALGTAWLQKAWLQTHFLGFGLLALAAWSGKSATLGFATVLLTLSVACYLCEIARVFSHLSFKRTS